MSIEANTKMKLVKEIFDTVSDQLNLTIANINDVSALAEKLLEVLDQYNIEAKDIKNEQNI